MKIEGDVFPEPLLEFGDQHGHADPRVGLMEGGPLQTHVGDALLIGVVGSQATVEHAVNFITDAGEGFDSASDKHPNMHPEFPGLGNRNPYRCKLKLDPAAQSALTKAQIEKIVKEPDHNRAVEMGVDAIMSSLQTLADSGHKPDVAIVALPVELIERVWRAKTEARSTTEADDASGSDAPNFRGLLKAKAMHLPFAIQIVWEDVINDAAKIPRKIKETSDRKIQDHAGRAWNLFTALYYKGSGRVPWRRMPEEGEYRACYIGISFYRDVSGQQLWTSTAQMFDERGRGFILQGPRAQTETRGRHPYMTDDDAYNLIDKVFAAYKDHHGHFPARVIVLKTSRFRDEEAEGIIRAMSDHDVERRDLVWIQESYAARILRDGDYPVMRGTFVDLGGKGLLYTNGSIPYYGTYPGQYVPNPLMLGLHKRSDGPIAPIAKEIFALTKINWNSTQMNQKHPIPIRAARRVSEVLKYVPEGQPISSDYRKYI